MNPITLLVISNPTAPHLRLLDQLAEPVSILVGNDIEFLRTNTPKADVILNGSPDTDLLREVFPLARQVRWVHILSAGLDKALFPELIESPVPVTNGRGVFKDALSEFVLASILFFAKDLRQLVHNQEAGHWGQFDIVKIREQVLGIVGYGGIGKACAQLARGVGMKVVATRRRTALFNDDPLLERSYPLDQLREMLSICDYVVVSTPLTQETKGLIGDTELRAMKRSAVIINVGRGPVIVEAALIAALTGERIKGAALDVFDVEPLPAGHPFYNLRNVLLSPHSADHTVDWVERATQRFADNFAQFQAGQPLDVVDKRAGY